MKTKQVTYGQLANGDRVIVEGHCMAVANLRRGYIDAREVVRFEGEITDKSDPLYNTGFNGGIYGARVDIPCAVLLK